jgi:DNA-directed RNA polymerase specialized sigma24 family protein
MPFEGEALTLTALQRSELEEIARSQSLPAGFVQRSKILLLLADGLSYQAVADKLDTSTPTVGKWKKRFVEVVWTDSRRIAPDSHRPS